MDNSIKRLRQSLGLTQQSFAAKLGVTRESISNYELGRREPSANILKKIQNVFGVSDSKIGEIILEYAKQKKSVS